MKSLKKCPYLGLALFAFTMMGVSIPAVAAQKNSLSKVSAEAQKACGEYAESLVLAILATKNPTVGKVENPEDSSPGPWFVGGLNGEEGAQERAYLQKDSSRKKEGSAENVVYHVPVASHVGNWECAYDVSFAFHAPTGCSLMQIKRGLCANGVEYPKSKSK